jgi:thiol-disulfide isomerase/thioredoxin
VNRRAALLLAAAALISSCGSGEPPARRAGPATVLGLEQLAARLAPRESGPASEPARPLIVNFWAIWCAPCVAELPELAQVAAEHAESVDVVTVSFDLALPYAPGIESADDVAAFLAERGLDLDVIVFDGSVEELSARLGLPSAIPFTVGLDRAGRRVGMLEGQADREKFEALFARVAL